MNEENRYIDMLSKFSDSESKEKAKKYAENIAKSMSESFAEAAKIYAKEKEVKEKKEDVQMAVSIIAMRVKEEIIK